MIKVKPAPGELAIAHEARIGRHNMCRTQTDALNLLNPAPPKIQGQRASRRISRLENLAIHSEMSPTDYAKQHSMLPAFEFASPESVLYGQGGRSAAFLDMRTPRPGAYCCVDCIKEDMGFWKYSWFRRWHNQVGVDWCQLHGRNLSVVVGSQPYMKAPNEWLALSALQEVEAEHPVLPQSGIIRRYVDIATALLDRDRPFKQAVINMHVGEVARSRGLATFVAKPKLLSAFLQQKADKKWFADNFNDIKRKAEPSRYFDWIPARLDKGFASHIYALILAGLYDSSDDALNAIHLIGKKSVKDSNGQPSSENASATRDNDHEIPKSPHVMEALRNFLGGFSIADACVDAGVSTVDLESYLRTSANPIFPKQISRNWD